jgi:hypothetical protein
LLEVVTPEKRTRYMDPKVDFLHRSARDFLVSGAVSEASTQPARDRLQTWLLVCNAIVLVLRRSPEYVLRLDELVIPALNDLAYVAKKAQDVGAESHALKKIISYALTAVSISEESKFEEGIRKFTCSARDHGVSGFEDAVAGVVACYKMPCGIEVWK